MNYFIAYCIISIVCESIIIITGYKKWKEAFNTKPELIIMKQWMMGNKKAMEFKKKFLNWYTIPTVIFPICLIVCPLIFPFSVFTKIKNIFKKEKSDAQQIL